MEWERGGILLDLSDIQILERFKAGDHDIYAELVKRYQQDAYKLALSILQHRYDAEDAVSEAFCRAYTAMGRCREGQGSRGSLDRRHAASARASWPAKRQVRPCPRGDRAPAG